jgi:1,4-dihydroxy-2-naphthoyl-CoA hydrolase
VTDSESLHTPNLDNASDFLVAAGLQFTHVAADRVEGVIDLGPEHHQPWGLVHGGVYTTAIESAATVGAVTAASKHALVAVGVNNNTNFLRSMISGRVQVVARPIQQGRTQQLWEVSISDADGRLVAIGQVRLQNVVPRTDSTAAGGRSLRSDAAASNERNSSVRNAAPADGREIDR